jgi:ribosomal-protein-alanine N-acetyltransferase
MTRAETHHFVLKDRLLDDFYPAQLEALDNSFFPNPWSHRAWEDFAKNPANYYLVSALAEGRQSEEEAPLHDGPEGTVLVGYSLFLLSELESLAHLLKIVVRPSWRQMGLGRRMIQEGIQTLVGKGFERIFLEVEENNVDAVNLYQTMGFRRLHYSKHFYGPGRHAVIMDNKIKP